MQYLISIAAGLAGGIAAVLLFGRRRSRRRTDSKNDRRKIEFSKLVLSAVLLTYFAGFVIGARAVAFDPSQLGRFPRLCGNPGGNGNRLLQLESKGGKRGEDQAGKPDGDGGNARRPEQHSAIAEEHK